MAGVDRVRVGSLRHLATLEKRQGQNDIDAGPDMWQPVAVVRCGLRPLRSNELRDEIGAGTVATHEITIRYVRDVTADMRLNVGGRIFEISSVVDNEDRNRWLKITASEVT